MEAAIIVACTLADTLLQNANEAQCIMGGSGCKPGSQVLYLVRHCLIAMGGACAIAGPAWTLVACCSSAKPDFLTSVDPDRQVHCVRSYVCHK